MSRAVGPKTLKICINHGAGPRSTNAVDGTLVKSQQKLIPRLNKFDYFNFTNQTLSMSVGKLQYLLPEHKRIVFGYPRCDHLINNPKLKDKKVTREIVSSIDKNDKVILYSPTWRFFDQRISFPLSKINDFSFEHLDAFLIENKAFLLVSKHPATKEVIDVSNFKRIKFIPFDPLFEINNLLPEVDCLITDYSSIATDFLLLKRPIIYVMPDYDIYFKKIGLLEDMRIGLPGYNPKTFLELLNSIFNSLYNHRANRQKEIRYLSKYYDVSINDSCKRFKKFLEAKL